MELFEYIKHLIKFWKWLVIGLVLGGLVGGTLAYLTADAYKASVGLYVQRATDESNSEYFTYEGYYAQQTAAEYAKTVVELLTNDEIVKRAAEYAELPTDEASILRIKGKITTEQDAPQLIDVTVTMSSQEQASELAEGLAQAVKNRTAEINRDGDAKLTIAQVDDNPFVVLVRPLMWLYVAVGAILGLVFALIASAVTSYFRSQK